jgi:tRNA A37 threonylcarbamoyltransferase TsaD
LYAIGPSALTFSPPPLYPNNNFSFSGIISLKKNKQKEKKEERNSEN